MEEDSYAPSKFGRTIGMLHGEKRFEEIHTNLVQIRNQLLVCSDDWEKVCKSKAKSLKKMIGKTDPEGLDERIDALCKFNLSNRDAFGYGECMNNTKKVWEAEMMLEISKQRRFFESMNRESI